MLLLLGEQALRHRAGRFGAHRDFSIQRPAWTRAFKVQSIQSADQPRRVKSKATWSNRASHGHEGIGRLGPWKKVRQVHALPGLVKGNHMASNRASHERPANGRKTLGMIGSRGWSDKMAVDAPAIAASGRLVARGQIKR